MKTLPWLASQRRLYNLSDHDLLDISLHYWLCSKFLSNRRAAIGTRHVWLFSANGFDEESRKVAIADKPYLTTRRPLVSMLRTRSTQLKWCSDEGCSWQSDEVLNKSWIFRQNHFHEICGSLFFLADVWKTFPCFRSLFAFLQMNRCSGYVIYFVSDGSGPPGRQIRQKERCSSKNFSEDNACSQRAGRSITEHSFVTKKNADMSFRDRTWTAFVFSGKLSFSQSWT